MDFVEYMKTKKRMTKSCTIGCHTCGLSSDNNKRSKRCDIFERDYPEEAQRIVDIWGVGHPQKTRAQDFFEKHPKAPKNYEGDPVPCAHNVGYCEDCDHRSPMNCHNCWNEPLEE